MDNNIQDKINEIIPFIQGDFITYPLWEEGKYIPFVNFWQRACNKKEINILNKKLRKLDTNTGYKIGLDTNTGYKIGIELKEYVSVVFNIFIYPDFKDTDDGGYEFIKSDWSIEEMIDMIKQQIK